MTKENKQDCNLQVFRAEIDKIDDQIIKLLQDRMKIVAQVTSLKKANNDKFFIKSAREVDMIKDLIKKTDSIFPPAVIANMWRKIITTANMHEQPIRVIIHNPKDLCDYKYLVREYYSEIVPVIELDSSNSVVVELEKNPAQIAVFAIPSEHTKDDDNWWIKLAGNKIGLQIFAKTPLIKCENTIELFLAAIKPAEKSQSDSSLLVVEVDEKFSKNDFLSALKNANLSAKILKTVNDKQFAKISFYLVEVDGFYIEEDVEIQKLKKDKIAPFVRVIGHFANQIEV